jgi:hypothetical protein
MCILILFDSTMRWFISKSYARWAHLFKGTRVTPAFPVKRPIPPAINAAFCSCRQTTVLIFESDSVSNTLSIFAPGMPKTYSPRDRPTTCS